MDCSTVVTFENTNKNTNSPLKMCNVKNCELEELEHTSWFDPFVGCCVTSSTPPTLQQGAMFYISIGSICIIYPGP